MTFDANTLTNNPDYQEIASFNHNEAKEFIRKEIAQQPIYARIANSYQLGGILAFMLGLFKAFIPFMKGINQEPMLWFGLGILFSFSFLIIIHELIHALSYRLIGARNLKFGMNLKKFIFYVVSDMQIINYKQFQFIALSPSVAISILTLSGMTIYYNENIFYFLLPIFGLHSLFGAGDFGLLCFFQNRTEKNILSFDNCQEGKTYFYTKKNNSSIESYDLI